MNIPLDNAPRWRTSVLARTDVLQGVVIDGPQALPTCAYTATRSSPFAGSTYCYTPFIFHADSLFGFTRGGL